MQRSDTIFALSSGKLPSGVGVIRVTGDRTRSILDMIVGFCPAARQLRIAEFRDPNGLIIDRGLVVFFEAPASFTGEDSAEFHVHGSHAVVRKMAETLAALDSVRPAEAGEFTQRAFLNGKFDLAEAEGLSDLLSAETETQRRLAVSQSHGVLSKVYAQWRERLVYCRSMVEASIDFSDEDHVAELALKNVVDEISAIATEIGVWLDRSANSEIVRDGFNVVIVGAPNAGKSSLLNVLAGRDAAITSDEPGTTRDLVDIRLELAGNLVIVTDTAGIRAGAGKVESLGIERALARARSADLVLLLEDVSNPRTVDLDFPQEKQLRIGNKIDLVDVFDGEYDLLISTKTMTGIDSLVGEISRSAESLIGIDDNLVVQQRQKALLAECVRCLVDCNSIASLPDLLAEKLRVATDCVGRLTGHVDVEELLGVIFSRFCIGK